MYGSIKDRIPEEFKPDREGWAHIGMAALIAILISSLIVLALLPAKATITDIDRLDAAYAALDDGLAAINDAGPYATTEGLTNVNAALTDYALNVIDLTWRVTATENAIDEIAGSPYEWQLSSGYQLHIFGNGNFTANMYLCIEPVVAVNATTYSDAVAFFYSGVNRATASQEYIPVVAFTGSTWVITQVWFNIGQFDVPTERTLDITVAGLNTTYNIEYAYVGVYEL